MSDLTFSIVLEPDPESGGFVVTVPALPEVVSQGDSKIEALDNVREAIELAIEHRRALGEPVPGDLAPEIRQITVAA